MAMEQNFEEGIIDDEDPMSAKLVEARKATFGDRWPHEGKRGWTCKTQKVCYAGRPSMFFIADRSIRWSKLDGIIAL